MKPLRRVSAIALPLPIDNIDTDAIIPSVAVKRAGQDRSLLGKGLFEEWRCKPGGEIDHDFALNMPRYAGAEILVTGQNFGCGSSREHAPWAISAWGFRVVIAGGFGDIFRDNCVKNGILPIVLEEEDLASLILAVQTCAQGGRTEVDLEYQAITMPDGQKIAFSIPQGDRTTLLEGLDDIDQTLRHSATIARFEAARRAEEPWVYFL